MVRVFSASVPTLNWLPSGRHIVVLDQCGMVCYTYPKTARRE